MNSKPWIAAVGTASLMLIAAAFSYPAFGYGAVPADAAGRASTDDEDAHFSAA